MRGAQPGDDEVVGQVVEFAVLVQELQVPAPGRVVGVVHAVLGAVELQRRDPVQPAEPLVEHRRRPQPALPDPDRSQAVEPEDVPADQCAQPVRGQVVAHVGEHQPDGTPIAQPRRRTAPTCAGTSPNRCAASAGAQPAAGQIRAVDLVAHVVAHRPVQGRDRVRRCCRRTGQHPSHEFPHRSGLVVQELRGRQYGSFGCHDRPLTSPGRASWRCGCAGFPKSPSRWCPRPRCADPFPARTRPCTRFRRRSARRPWPKPRCTRSR